MTRRKPQPMPNIDLAGKVGIIELDENCKPFMKILGECFATHKNALEILEKHGMNGGWLITSFGKEWVGK